MLKKLLVTTAIVAIASSAYAAEATMQNKTTGAMNPPAIGDLSAANIAASDRLASDLIGLAVYSGAPLGATDSTMTAPNAGANMQAQTKPMQNGQTTNGQMQNNANVAQNSQPATGQPANRPAVNGQAQDNTTLAQNNQEHIGDINDLVVAQDGSIDAVIIGVGGFLGMGEKNVAVPYDSLQWSTDGNGSPVAYLAVSKDQLTSAPNFDVSMLQPNANGANQPAMGTPAPQGTVAMNTPANTGAGAAVNTPDNTGTAVDVTKISANDLMGTTVYDGTNQNVGNVGDVIVTKDGKIDAVVVDIGGFLGIGEKPVAIAFDDLNIRKDENGALTAYTTFSKEQLDNAPKYDKEAYQSQRDSMRLHTQG